MTPDASNDSPDTGGGARRLSGWSMVVAIAVLVGFGAMVVYVATQADADEQTWTRLAWLLSSVEALAFGAAGAVFGASVQRERAVNAEQRADENERDAVAGRTLAETIKAGAKTRPAEPPPGAPSFDIAPPPGAGPAADAMGRRPGPSADTYVDLANRLFPD